jgi:hypothetical protein
MTCSLCGTQFSDGSPDCPHCKVAQASTKIIDQASSSAPMQPGQPIIYQEIYMPEQPTPYQGPYAPGQSGQPLPYQGPYAPGSGMLPANAPMYMPLPSSRPRKKKTFTIAELVGAGVVVVFVIGIILFHSLYTVALNAATSMTVSSTQKVVNPYTKQTDTLAISDPLKDNSIADKHKYHWMDDSTDDTPGEAADTQGCGFEGNNYHVTTSEKDPVIYCITSGARFSNFTYQVQTNIQLGHAGGIIFRQSPGAHFYAFVISDAGSYILLSNSGADAKVLTEGTSNLLAVVANGTKLDLYINQQQVASVTDSTYSVGIIGMIAVGDDDAPNVDMAYHDAKVWISSK